MKNKKPLVSIIVPAYNTSKFVGFCLDSLVEQTYREIEIIVVDDGSTDGTADIVKKYAIKDRRVKLIDGKHRGANMARGLGVEKAKGVYYMFVDSDDWLNRKTVAILVDKILKTKCDVIRFNAYIKPGDKLKNPYIKEKDVDKKISGKDARRLLAMTHVLDSLCFQFYCSYLFNNEKIFDKELSNSEDYFANLKIYDKVKTVLFMGDVFYHYRYNNNSTTKNSDMKRLSKNIEEQLFVHSFLLKKINTWDFDSDEMVRTSTMLLDRIRGSVFALSKSRGMNRRLFCQMMEKVFESDDYQFVNSCVGSRKNVVEFVDKSSFFYKIKCGKSVVCLYDNDANSFWRMTIVRRFLSGLRNSFALKIEGGVK